MGRNSSYGERLNDSQGRTWTLMMEIVSARNILQAALAPNAKLKLSADARESATTRRVCGILLTSCVPSYIKGVTLRSIVSINPYYYFICLVSSHFRSSVQGAHSAPGLARRRPVLTRGSRYRTAQPRPIGSRLGTLQIASVFTKSRSLVLEFVWAL